jgi:hypothetical protein
MVKASQWESADPQVHAVLGVLYNASEDFDAAVAAFRTALAARPDDYTLWNKVRRGDPVVQWVVQCFRCSNPPPVHR